MKKELKKILRKEKGITLVALIITVILMLILAGVAISAVIDGGGLFRKTREATKAYENSAKDENKTISNLMNYIERYMNDNVVNTEEEKIKINVAVNSSNEISAIVLEDLDNIVEYEYYINNELASKTDQNTYTNSDLEPDTEYTVYVVITDLDGNKYYSQTVKVKTKARVYLYQGSRETDDECIDITGGWEGVGTTDIRSSDGTLTYTATVPAITRNSDNIYAKHTLSGKMSTGTLTTVNKIDVTNYTKLRVDISAYTTAYCWVYIIVNQEKDKFYTMLASNQVAYKQKESVTFPRDIVEIDVSDINQEVYIQINYCKGTAYTGTYYSESTLYNAWLE